MCWAPPLPELSEFHLGTAILFCRNATATGLRSFEPVGSCGIRLIQHISTLNKSEIQHTHSNHIYIITTCQ